MRLASYIGGMYPLIGEPAWPELWENCVGAWAPCLGPTGVTLRDWSGYGNNGTLTNMDAGTDWIPSSGCYALDFDGTNDHILTPSRVFPQTSFSLSMWVKAVNASATYQFASAYNQSIGAYLQFFQFSNAYRFRIHQTRDAVFIGRLGGTASTNWTHICGVWSGGTTSASISLFANGVQVDTTNDQAGTFTAPFATAIPLYIGTQIAGAGSPNASTAGLIDDVRMYSRPLNPVEVRQLSVRRGIAYELAPRRRSSAAVIATFNRRRRLLVGAGS